MPPRLPITPHPALAGLPDRLRLAREAAGMTQEELAQALGYAGKQIISHWERGVALPTLPALCEVAALLDLDPSTLAFLSRHDRVRLERAEGCNRDDLESVAEAIRGLQSTDNPLLVPLHDALLKRYHELTNI